LGLKKFQEQVLANRSNPNTGGVLKRKCLANSSFTERSTANWMVETFAKCLIQSFLCCRFREAKERALVTTDVSTNCMDLEQLTLVVNFDLPIDSSGRADSKTYLRRIGHTGGFRKSVVVINFVLNDNDSENLDEIAKHFGIKIEKLDTDNYFEMQEKIVDEWWCQVHVRF